MFKREIRAPILAFFLISLGGLLLHLRIHPPSEDAGNWVPGAFGLANAFVLPFMFNDARTVAWAYVITLITVIVGAVGMAHFSVTHWEGPVTVHGIVLQSTLADILILLAKLPLAHMVLRHFTRKDRP